MFRLVSESIPGLVTSVVFYFFAHHPYNAIIAKFVF